MFSALPVGRVRELARHAGIRHHDRQTGRHRHVTTCEVAAVEEEEEVAEAEEGEEPEVVKKGKEGEEGETATEKKKESS